MEIKCKRSEGYLFKFMSTTIKVHLTLCLNFAKEQLN